MARLTMGPKAPGMGMPPLWVRHARGGCAIGTQDATRLERILRRMPEMVMQRSERQKRMTMFDASVLGSIEYICSTSSPSTKRQMYT